MDESTRNPHILLRQDCNDGTRQATCRCGWTGPWCKSELDMVRGYVEHLELSNALSAC